MPELIEDGTYRFGEPDSPTAIALYNGQLFDILDPDTWVFKVETIAISLSNQCRFRGHVDFYSVAEHAVRVSEWLEDFWHNPLLSYMGLHHDDMEAYLGDTPSPHKRITSIAGEPAKDLEETLEYAYFATLGVLTDDFDENWKKVKKADLAVYLMERDERPKCGRGLYPLMARAEYMARHHELAWQFAGAVPEYVG